MSLYLFEARALAATIEFLDAHGYLSEPMLHQLGIPSEMIERGGWVSIDQFYRVASAGAELAGGRDAIMRAELGFFQLDHLGPIMPALHSCKTVMETLTLATRMAQRGYQGCHYFIDVRGETAWLSFSNPRLDPNADPFVDDITLGVFVHLLRSVIGDDWQPQHLRTQDQTPGRYRGVAVIEDCRIDFDPLVSGVAFPTRFLSREVPWASEAKSFEASEWPPQDELFSDGLYRLLASHFRYDQIPSRDRTARLIGISPATLKRNLASTGMTYRGVVDRLRHDAACEMLLIPQMSVKDIALELGFSGTNNFVRSFRRMTGVSPGEYRRQQQMNEQ